MMAEIVRMKRQRIRCLKSEFEILTSCQHLSIIYEIAQIIGSVIGSSIIIRMNLIAVYGLKNVDHCM